MMQESTAKRLAEMVMEFNGLRNGTALKSEESINLMLDDMGVKSMSKYQSMRRWIPAKEGWPTCFKSPVNSNVWQFADGSILEISSEGITVLEDPA